VSMSYVFLKNECVTRPSNEYSWLILCVGAVITLFHSTTPS
jgi:hypothetical protein